MGIDYEDLLRKYIDHVGECESITYIDRLSESTVEFSAEEVEALRRLDNEAREAFRRRHSPAR